MKKQNNTIWIVIIGVIVAVSGVLIWGFATNWGSGKGNSEENVRKIQEKLNKANQALVKSQENLNLVKQRVKKAEKDVKNTEIALDKAIQQVFTTQKKVRDLEDKATKISGVGDLEKVKKELEDAKKAKKAAEGELTTVQDQLTKANAAKEALHGQLTAANQATSTANAAKEALQDQLTAANQATSTANAAKEALQDQLTAANQATSTANAAKETLQDQLTVANQATSTANAAKETLQDQLTAANQATSTANAAKETLQDQLTVANQATSTANAAKTAAESQLTTANAEVKKYCNKFPNKWYDEKAKCQPRITECEYGKYLKVNPEMGKDNTCVNNTAIASCKVGETEYKSIYSNSAECLDLGTFINNVASYNIIDKTKSEQDIIDAYKKYIDSDDSMTKKKWMELYRIYWSLWKNQNRYPSQQNVPTEVKWFSDIFPSSLPNNVKTYPPSKWDSSDDDNALTVQQRDAIKTTVRNMTGAPLKTLLKRLTEETGSPLVMSADNIAKLNESKQLCTQIFKNLGDKDVTDINIGGKSDDALLKCWKGNLDASSIQSKKRNQEIEKNKNRFTSKVITTSKYDELKAEAAERAKKKAKELAAANAAKAAKTAAAAEKLKQLKNKCKILKNSDGTYKSGGGRSNRDLVTQCKELDK